LMGNLEPCANRRWPMKWRAFAGGGGVAVAAEM
jgi:hypothetical protein